MAAGSSWGKVLDRAVARERDLCLAMILGRVTCPLASSRDGRTLGESMLASELGVDGATRMADLAMDWLPERQDRIEDRLAARHLRDGEMVLDDVSSSYFEGRTCPLARLGYSRDGKRGLPQIIYGLLCDNGGRRAVEVFSGELHDDKTLPLTDREAGRTASVSRGSSSSRIAGWSPRRTSRSSPRPTEWIGSPR